MVLGAYYLIRLGLIYKEVQWHTEQGSFHLSEGRFAIFFLFYLFFFYLGFFPNRPLAFHSLLSDPRIPLFLSIFVLYLVYISLFFTSSAAHEHRSSSSVRSFQSSHFHMEAYLSLSIYFGGLVELFSLRPKCHTFSLCFDFVNFLGDHCWVLSSCNAGFA
jgi:hypothetical protein